MVRRETLTPAVHVQLIHSLGEIAWNGCVNKSAISPLKQNFEKGHTLINNAFLLHSQLSKIAIVDFCLAAS